MCNGCEKANGMHFDLAIDTNEEHGAKQMFIRKQNLINMYGWIIFEIDCESFKH